MLNIGPMEIGFVLGIIILLFGPDKLPQLARILGRATNEYKRALNEVSNTGNSFISDIKSGATNTGNENKSESAMSDEEKIIENAKALGIETEGKTINQLIDEILEKTG